jgi:hypothetical protein
LQNFVKKELANFAIAPVGRDPRWASLIVAEPYGDMSFCVGQNKFVSAART